MKYQDIRETTDKQEALNYLNSGWVSIGLLAVLGSQGKTATRFVFAQPEGADTVAEKTFDVKNLN